VATRKLERSVLLTFATDNLPLFHFRNWTMSIYVMTTIIFPDLVFCKSLLLKLNIHNFRHRQHTYEYNVSLLTVSYFIPNTNKLEFTCDNNDNKKLLKNYLNYFATQEFMFSVQSYDFQNGIKIYHARLL
jgi:hypothetical protein